jgi:hypothetical protein
MADRLLLIPFILPLSPFKGGGQGHGIMLSVLNGQGGYRRSRHDGTGNT